MEAFKNAFNGSKSKQDELVSCVADAVRDNKLRTMKCVYDEKTGVGSPFGLFIKSTDFSRIEPELGIPLPIANIYEALFAGFARVNETSRIIEPIPVEGGAARLTEFLSTIKPGADLSSVIARLLAGVCDAYAQDETVNGDLRPVLITMRDLYLQSLDGVARGKEWKAVRKSAMAVYDTYKGQGPKSDFKVAYFAETAAWPADDIVAEVPTLIESLIGLSIRYAHQAAHTDAERTASSEFFEEQVKLSRTLGRPPTPEEAEAMPERKKLLEVFPVERQLETARAAAAGGRVTGELLHKAMIDAIVKATT